MENPETGVMQNEPCETHQIGLTSIPNDQQDEPPQTNVGETEEANSEQHNTLPFSSEQLSVMIQEALECPVCYENMAAPIWMCTSGHSLCPRCRLNLSSCPICRNKFLTTTRNYVLEKISQDYRIVPVELSVLECNRCPLWMFKDCSWVSHNAQMIDHIREKHADHVLDENQTIWSLNLVTKDIKVILYRNDIFIYRERLNTISKEFFIAVKHLDLNSSNIRYTYNVKLSAGKSMKKISHPMLDKDSDISNIEVTRNCIVIDYNVVNMFIKEKGMKYELFIDLDRD